MLCTKSPCSSIRAILLSHCLYEYSCEMFDFFLRLLRVIVFCFRLLRVQGTCTLVRFIDYKSREDFTIVPSGSIGWSRIEWTLFIGSILSNGFNIDNLKLQYSRWRALDPLIFDSCDVATLFTSDHFRKYSIYYCYR